MPSWNAYRCQRLQHFMFVFESMDADTETRRLSPIALHGGNTGAGNYTDMINGPMNHREFSHVVYERKPWRTLASMYLTLTQPGVKITPALDVCQHSSPLLPREQTTTYGQQALHPKGYVSISSTHLHKTVLDWTSGSKILLEKMYTRYATLYHSESACIYEQ